jgi:hypothetical protein
VVILLKLALPLLRLSADLATELGLQYYRSIIPVEPRPATVLVTVPLNLFQPCSKSSRDLLLDDAAAFTTRIRRPPRERLGSLFMGPHPKMKTSASARLGTCAPAGAQHGARSSVRRAAPPRCIAATPPHRGLKDRLANLEAPHAAMADNVTFPWPLDTLEEIVALMVPTAKGSSTVAIRLSKAKVRHVTLTEEAALCFRKWTRGRDPNKHVLALIPLGLRTLGALRIRKHLVRSGAIACCGPCACSCHRRQTKNGSNSAPLSVNWRRTLTPPRLTLNTLEQAQEL